MPKFTLPLALLYPPAQIIYPPVIIGATDHGENIDIYDSVRHSGLYILGKPRMGKSWLMVRLIIDDIRKKHGVFFLDPHGDAIDDLINRITSQVILLMISPGCR